MQMRLLGRKWFVLAMAVALLTTGCGGSDAKNTPQAELEHQVQEGERSSTTPQASVESGQATVAGAASSPVDEINYGEPGQPFSVERPGVLVPLQVTATDYTPELCEALQDFDALYRSDNEVNTLRFNGRNDAVISAAEAVASLDAPGAEIASFFDALASMFREGAVLTAELRDDTENWEELDRRRLKFEQGSVFLHDQVGIGARVMLHCGIRLSDGIVENQYPNLRPLVPAPTVTYPIAQQGVSDDLEFANIRAEVSWGEPVEVNRARGIENPTFDASAEALLYLYFDARPTGESSAQLKVAQIELVLADGARIAANIVNTSGASAFSRSRVDPDEWVAGIASVPMQFAPLDNARVRRPDLTGAAIEISRGEDVLRLPLDG